MNKKLANAVKQAMDKKASIESIDIQVSVKVNPKEGKFVVYMGTIDRDHINMIVGDAVLKENNK